MQKLCKKYAMFPECIIMQIMQKLCKLCRNYANYASLQKLCKLRIPHFADGPRTVMDVLFNRGRAVRKGTQASASKKKRGQPLAPRCCWRETISLISCIVLLWFFFSLGFKFCCMVLRVANARTLFIDLRRLCYLQPVQWITTRADSDNCTLCTVIWVSTTISCTLSFLRVTVGSWISKPPLGAEFLLLNSGNTLTTPWYWPL